MVLFILVSCPDEEEDINDSDDDLCDVQCGIPVETRVTQNETEIDFVGLHREARCEGRQMSTQTYCIGECCRWTDLQSIDNRISASYNISPISGLLVRSKILTLLKTSSVVSPNSFHTS